MTTLPKVKRVAVVGGGPAGVSVAKYLVAERAFDTIDVFEQRSDAGGVWRYTPENDTDATFAIPSTSPDVGLEKPFWRYSDETSGAMKKEGVNGEGKRDERRATFISPLYERLEANLPKMLMQYTDFPFPDDEQLFPTHAAITEYLERYADEVRHLIHFSTQVTSISPLPSPSTGWSVSTHSLTTNTTQTQIYDAVAIANGHFAVPFIPDLPGIKEWNERNPGVINHSKFYRRPDEFGGKKILTIGSGYSGLDIASQVEAICAPPLLHSTRSQPSTLSTNPSTNTTPDTATRTTVPSIHRFLDSGTRAIEFEDGWIETDIDAVIFATGYLYSYPFLSLTPKTSSDSPDNSTSPPSTTNSMPKDPGTPLTIPTPTPPTSTSTGERTPNTYQHLFSTLNPTLAYLTLPQKIVPFPTSQAQAAVLARVWSGRLTLPSLTTMAKWESARIAQKGEGKRFHYLDGGEDVSYLGMLGAWADCARQPELAEDGNGIGNGVGNGDGNRHHLGEDGKVGKPPPRWGEKERWMRERVGEIKKAWVGFGSGRKEVRTLEACGFDFETWKRGEEGKVTNNGVDGDHSRGDKTDDVEDAANGGQAEG